MMIRGCDGVYSLCSELHVWRDVMHGSGAV